MGNQEKILALLNECAVVAQLSGEEKIALAKVGEIKTILASDKVFDMGEDRNNHFYIVESGKLLLQLRTNQTKEYSRGELFGEVAIFTEGYRMGTVFAQEDSQLVVFDKAKLFDSKQLNPEVALRVISCLTSSIIDYLSSYLIDRVNIPTQTLIRAGEGETIEFKASFDKNTKNAIVKSMGGFMNNKGGTILIGVSDRRDIHGISVNDGWELDRISREISQALRAKLVDVSLLDLVSIDTKEMVNGKRLIRIDCASSSQAVFFKEIGRGNIKKEIFYLRLGSENQRLEKVSQIVRAIRNRDAKSA